MSNIVFLNMIKSVHIKNSTRLLAWFQYQINIKNSELTQNQDIHNAVRTFIFFFYFAAVDGSWTLIPFMPLFLFISIAMLS